MLSFELLEKKTEADRTAFRYAYSREQKVEVIVEHQTATMTSVQINYGVSGAAVFANLLAREIAVEHHRAGAFLEDPLTGQR